MEITVGDVFDAIEENGLPKGKESYFQYERLENDEINLNKIVAACAIGQAAVNIARKNNTFIDADNLYSLLRAVDVKLPETIIYLNDKTDMTLKEIADDLRLEYAKVLDKLVFHEFGS